MNFATHVEVDVDDKKKQKRELEKETNKSYKQQRIIKMSLLELFLPTWYISSVELVVITFFRLIWLIMLKLK